MMNYYKRIISGVLLSVIFVFISDATLLAEGLTTDTAVIVEQDISTNTAEMSISNAVENLTLYGDQRIVPDYDTESRSYDLNSIEWHVSALATPEEVKIGSIKSFSDWTTVTLPSLLEVDSATTTVCYVGIVDSYADLPSGEESLVTIGHPYGDCSVWINGTKCRKVIDEGLSKALSPQYNGVSFRGSPLGKGLNVIVLQVRNIQQDQRIGIGSSVFTLSSVLIENEGVFSVGDANVITTETAMRSIEEYNQKYIGSNSQKPLFQKERTISRFGGNPTVCLPAVMNVSPTEIWNNNSPKFKVALDAVTTVCKSAVLSGEIRLDQQNAAWQVKGRTLKKDVDYTFATAMTYPGGIYKLSSGQILPIRLEFPQSHGMLQILHPKQLKVLLPNMETERCSVLLAAEGITDTVPMMIVITDATYNIISDTEIVEMSVVAGTSKDAYIHVIFPFGQTPKNLANVTDDMTKTVALLEKDVHPSETISKWLTLAMNFPVSQDEWFRLLGEENNETTISLYQLTKYTIPSGLSVPVQSQWIPPCLSTLRALLRQDVSGPELMNTGIITKSGDFRVPEADFVSKDNIHVVRFEMPIVKCQFESAFAVSASADLVNNYLDDLTSESMTTIDDLFTRVYPSMIALPFATGKTRKKAIQDIRDFVDRSLDDIGRENGYTFTTHDALGMYGLLCYFRHEGNWDELPKYWDSIKKQYSSLMAYDDWEFMSPVSNLFDYGGVYKKSYIIDGFAASAAYAEFAKVIKDSTELSKARYYLIRNELSLLAQFDALLLKKNVSLSEFAQLIAYDGIVVPQIVDVLISNRSREFGVLVKQLLLRERNKPLNAVALPLFYAGSVLGLVGEDDVRKRIILDYKDASSKNLNFAQLLVYSLTKSIPAKITSCGNARYVSSEAVRIERNWKLLSRFENRVEGNEVMFRMLNTKPGKVRVNGMPVPLPDIEHLDNNHCRIRLSRLGNNEIMFLF